MRLRIVSWAALSAGIVAGTFADRPVERPPAILAGYRVLAADFHNHSSTWSDGALTPMNLVLEAERQGLDVIAITGHNQVSDAKVGRWFSERVGGPLVIVGQEVLSPGHHVIALGTESVVDSNSSVSQQVDAIHRQGGVAIAAHPLREFWPSFDAEALRRLDGAEICHPMIFVHPEVQQEFEEFASHAPLAAIGSSDFHGAGRMGDCRTYVFAQDDSSASILEALRAHRTVVYGLHGKAYGDPALIGLAAQRPELQRWATADTPPSGLDWISRVLGACGLFGLVAGRRRRP